MKAEILKIEEEKLWDDFVKTHPLATIHQLSDWGHFQSTIPSRGKYWIIALKEDNKIIGGTVVVRHSLPKGYSWLYCPRGPLIDFHNHHQLKALLDELKNLAKVENSIFVRFDPPLTNHLKLRHFNAIKYGFQPQTTLVLDLKQTQEELLKDMKQKGRYNIRLAEKKGVKVRIADPKNAKQYGADLENFYNVLLETTERDGFTPHDQDFYQKMLASLPENTVLYLAEYENQLLSAMIVTNFGETSTYYYGASSNKNRHLMAPYLMQWQAIKDAKHSGKSVYDFMGIAPPKAKNHPWAGVTDFKLKFGGEVINYTKPLEFSFKPLHHFLYSIYKRFK